LGWWWEGKTKKNQTKNSQTKKNRGCYATNCSIRSRDYPGKQIKANRRPCIHPSNPWSPPPAVQATTELVVGWQVSVAYIVPRRVQPLHVHVHCIPKQKRPAVLYVSIGRWSAPLTGCDRRARQINLRCGAVHPPDRSKTKWMHPEFRIHPASSTLRQ
jgi:hypothetical protein